MKLSIIAAIGKNNELGINNNLIWHFKGDMQFFKTVTTNHTIVMGRKTFESLPKMLPNRKHIVLSRSNIELPNIEVYNSIESFLEKYQNSNEEIFNIGGAHLYQALLEYASKLYLTQIDAEAKADAFFPSFNEQAYDKIILANKIDENTNIKYRHVLYKRR